MAHETTQLAVLGAGPGGYAAAFYAADMGLTVTGLAALLDGLWLKWCLDPGSYSAPDAAALCDRWVGRIVGA